LSPTLHATLRRVNGILVQWKRMGHLVFHQPTLPSLQLVAAMKRDELHGMDCLIATLSVDPIKSHNDWLRDVVAHCENNIEVKFPIIADADNAISGLRYDRRWSSDEQAPALDRSCAFSSSTQKTSCCPSTTACPDVIWTKSSAASGFAVIVRKVYCHPGQLFNNPVRIFPWRTVLDRPRSGLRLLVADCIRGRSEERTGYHSCSFQDQLPSSCQAGRCRISVYRIQLTWMDKHFGEHFEF
jgi:hypothetical protein